MLLTAGRLRFVLAAEQVAFFFAAPYIILLGLDETRGFFDATTSTTVRLWGYALLVGLYPFLQIIVSPSIGRQFDKKRSKLSMLRRVHLANCFCYALLALSAYRHELIWALLGLSIPGIAGCAAPIGKSLITTLTDSSVRVKEFATLAFIKGVVKLIAPLAGAFLFQWLLNSSGFSPLFLISSAISFICFLMSFAFQPVIAAQSVSVPMQCATLSLFRSIVQRNYPLLFVFVFLLTGYSVFVKYTPLLVFEKLGENPSYINYFSAMVGLAYSLDQLAVVRFSKYFERIMPAIFFFLCCITIVLSLSNSVTFWFAGMFLILFCFSSLATCIEARLSLQGAIGTQGTVQGIIYSVENWSYLIAPVLGSALASCNMLYPLYFVTLCTLLAAFFYAYSHFVGTHEAYSKTR